MHCQGLHRRLLPILVLLLAPAGPAASLSPGAQPAPRSFAVVDVGAIGPARLDAVKALPQVVWWLEMDAELLVGAFEDDLGDLAEGAKGLGLEVVRRGTLGEGERLLIARTTHRSLEGLARAPGMTVIAEGGGYAVLRSRLDAAAVTARLHDLAHPGHAGVPGAAAGCGGHEQVLPLVPNQVLARQAANQPPRPSLFAGSANLGVQDLVDLVDEDRWFGDVESLAAFNRYTLGPGVLAARDWLVGRFSLLPALTVTTESFTVFGTPAFNVVATLPGTDRPDEWYIVGAHYDSISQSPSTAAPGAEDNASGCAGVLEMARIFSQHRPEATVIFICYSGEEEGLFGSADHAGDLVSSGNAAKVKGVLIMDMIGYTGDADLDCLLEANAASQGLIDAFEDAAAEYTSLRIVTSLNPFGSDHVPYLNRGMKALLTIENDWNVYPGYHRTTDLPANLSRPMGRETLKMNVAALALLAGAPPSLEALFGNGFETGDLSAWSEVFEGK